MNTKYDIELLKKHYNYSFLEQDAIRKLPTKRLLALLKSIRNYDQHGGTCDCCGESSIEMHGSKSAIEYKNQMDLNFNNYVNVIKSELSVREHIPKKKK